MGAAAEKSRLLTQPSGTSQALPASASMLWTMQRRQNSVELAGEPGRGSHGCESKAGQWACLEDKAFLVLDP